MISRKKRAIRTRKNFERTPKKERKQIKIMPKKKRLEKQIERKLTQLEELLSQIEEAHAINSDDPET